MRFLHVSLLRHCLAPFWKTLEVFSVASSDSRVFINFHSLANEADERLGRLGICNHNIDLRLTSIQPFTSLYPHEAPDILFNFCLNTLYESSLIGTPNRIWNPNCCVWILLWFPSGQNSQPFQRQQGRVLRICVQQGKEPSEKKSELQKEQTGRDGRDRNDRSDRMTIDFKGASGVQGLPEPQIVLQFGSAQAVPFFHETLIESHRI